MDAAPSAIARTRRSARPAARRSLGFTLIELAAVMVILGSLSAMAIPRFADISVDAHRVGVARSAAGFQTAVRLANIRCILSSWANRDNMPGYGGGRLDLNSSCFPADTSGANVIGGRPARCIRVWNAILALAPTITASPSGADYRASAAGSLCTFRYLRDTSATRQFTYLATNGQVVLTNP